MGDRTNEITESAEIKIKYEGYIKREKLIGNEKTGIQKLPDDIKYDELVSIRTEGRQKLSKITSV